MSEKRPLSRREFLKAGALSLGSLLLGGALEGCARPTTKEAVNPTFTRPTAWPPFETPTQTAHTATGTQASDGLRTLIEGNLRFARSESLYPRWDTARRLALLAEQKPFAAVLSCSDSRVPPEILFDQGLGDIFVVRTAGNTAGLVGLGSLEYAVEHLGVSLVLILGHQHCGAVTAAVQGSEAPGKIAAVLEEIHPAVEAVRATAGAQAGELLPNSIDANIAFGVEKIIGASTLLSGYADQGKIQVVGARYDLDTGLVDWLTGSPEMVALFPQVETTSGPQVTPTTQPAASFSAPTPLPQAQPAVEQPAQSQNREYLGVHIVRRGESLYAIGLAYGINPWAIARRNQITNPDLIYPGQRLRIPNAPWRKMPPGRQAERQF
jgi:carbonic anhydrase